MNSTKFTALLILTTVACLAMAQKTKVKTVRQELSQARTILKSGRNGSQAEQLMTALLKDSLNRTDKRIYDLWYEAVHQQYLAVNEKLYTKQRQDTAQFFELTRRLFTVAEALDSLDQQPDKKGRVAPEYRRRNSEQLMKYRANLLNGCTYYVGKGDYEKAYTFSEAYMDCARQPLFAAYRLDSIDSRMGEAAYWATYSGYRQHDPVLTLRHRKRALTDSTRCEYTLQYIAEAWRWLHDDSLYLATLQQGFSQYPENDYFFAHLMDYHTARSQYGQALAVADSALAAADSSQLYLWAKATVLFSMGRYDESIALSDTLIARNDSMADAYYNAGTCCLNKALKLHPLREKKQLKALYQKARHYMERYRQLAPDEKQKWGPALYRIYLNLNLGRQFDEIDRLLK